MEEVRKEEGKEWGMEVDASSCSAFHHFCCKDK